jgi:hypothetical protein
MSPSDTCSLPSLFEHPSPLPPFTRPPIFFCNLHPFVPFTMFGCVDVSLSFSLQSISAYSYHTLYSDRILSNYCPSVIDHPHCLPSTLGKRGKVYRQPSHTHSPVTTNTHTHQSLPTHTPPTNPPSRRVNTESWRENLDMNVWAPYMVSMSTGLSQSAPRC